MYVVSDDGTRGARGLRDTWGSILIARPCFIYRLNNEADSFRFGDSANIDLALGYRLFPGSYKSFHDKILNVYLEFNTLLSQRASLNGQEVLDSGGSVAFLSPGVQAVLTPRFLIEAAFQIPVL